MHGAAILRWCAYLHVDGFISDECETFMIANYKYSMFSRSVQKYLGRSSE